MLGSLHFIWWIEAKYNINKPSSHQELYIIQYLNFGLGLSGGSVLVMTTLCAGIMQADNSEQVILDPKLIARNYMRTWFFLDLISSVPLDYIFLIFNSIRGATIEVVCHSLFIAASHWEGEKVSQGDVQRKSTDWWWPVTWLSSVYQYILRVLGLLGQKSLLIVSSGKTSFRPHPPLEIHSFFTHPGTSITTMTTQLSLQPGETRITHITFYV